MFTPVSEPDHILEQTHSDNWPALLSPYRNRPKDTPARKYGNLPQDVQQGVTECRTTLIPMTQTQRANITFNHVPINPDTDIDPGTTSQVQRGRLNRYNAAELVDIDMVHVYNTDVCLKGTVSQHKYNLLKDRYDHTALHHPDVMTKHGVQSFEQELAHLMDRYQDGYE